MMSLIVSHDRQLLFFLLETWGAIRWELGSATEYLNHGLLRKASSTIAADRAPGESNIASHYL